MRDSDRAYQAMLEMLTYGEVESGDTVDDKILLEKIGVGRTPLREALVRLAQEGFVTAIPRKGMVWTVLDMNDLTSLLNLRRELSAYLAHLLIPRITDEDIEELRQAVYPVAEFDELEAGSFIKYDFAFHEKLNSITRDRFLMSTLNKLQHFSNIMIRPNISQFRFNPREVIREYEEVIEALQQRDERRLAKTLTEHIPIYSIQLPSYEYPEPKKADSASI